MLSYKNMLFLAVILGNSSNGNKAKKTVPPKIIGKALDDKAGQYYLRQKKFTGREGLNSVPLRPDTKAGHEKLIGSKNTHRAEKHRKLTLPQ